MTEARANVDELRRTFAGRRILVTGHTGFKGSWLWRLLEHLGAEVSGLALAQLDPKAAAHSLCGPGAASGFCDIRDLPAVRRRFDEIRPEAVLHLAAQALVRDGYRDPATTWSTNVAGTANVLAAAEGLPVVVVTTDKVYAQPGPGRPYRESDPLGGKDPYSASKAACEILASSWPPNRSHIVTVRAGNVIGGGDRGRDRLIPDAVRAVEAGRSLAVRFPTATRPWQHVLEPLFGYLLIADRLLRGEDVPPALNFGPDAAATATVSEVLTILERSLPGVRWHVEADHRWPEATDLQLSSDLAEATLGWRSLIRVDQAIAWTADWYSCQMSGRDLEGMTDAQIESYLAITG